MAVDVTMAEVAVAEPAGSALKRHRTGVMTPGTAKGLLKIFISKVVPPSESPRSGSTMVKFA